MSSWLLGGNTPSRDSSSSGGTMTTPAAGVIRTAGTPTTPRGVGTNTMVQEVLPHLYPQTCTSTESAVTMRSQNSGFGRGFFWGDSSQAGGSTGAPVHRFSTLLLEHGEEAIQDWGVVAYAAPWKAGLIALSRNQNNSSHANTTTPGNASPNSAGNKILWAQSPQRNTNHSSTNNAKRTMRTSSSSSLNGSKAATQTHFRSSADFTKDEYPTVHMNNISGRLFLCSRSLVFEPHDVTRGIIRCPWSRMENGGLNMAEQDAIQIYTTRHLIMKLNNIIGPFETIQVPTKFRFAFLHSSPHPMIELAQRLYHATKSPPPGTNAATAAEAELLHFRQEHQQQHTLFDMDNLVDVVREQLLLPPIPAKILTPLQSQAGVFVITTAERLYFQPGQINVMGAPPMQRAIRFQCADIVATARRYHGLRDSALEIYWNTNANKSYSHTKVFQRKKDNNNFAHSTLIAFERRHDREQVLRLLPLTAPCVTDRQFLAQVVQQWLEGNISNYDYLLALNAAAGRSFHDLSRYPVFPWVIADYESEEIDLDNPKTYRDLAKPVGALNPVRLDYFQQRLANMHDLEKDPFLYGTHYSTPAYVLYFLVRTMPEHMLCLQNGKFDTADRMFYSVAHCYQCCLTNQADVKELIPQFFSLDKFDLDFLRNSRGLSLGATQTGERVHDVLLPRWAKDSPRKFVQINRQALESTYCTQQLPSWIDLIFGFTSRGEPAKHANNLFHRIVYLGPRELADASPEERATAELQATEFGIVPDQLFQQPHPLQFNSEDIDMEALLAPHVGRAPSNNGDGGREAWELLDPPSNSNTTPSQPSGAEAVPPGGHDVVPSLPHSLSGNSQEMSRQATPASKSPENFGAPGSLERRTLPLRGTGETSSSLMVETTMNPFDSSDIYHHSTATQHYSQSQHAVSPAPPAAMMEQQPLRQATPSPAPPTTRTTWDMKMLERRQVHNDAVSGCVLLLVDSSEDAGNSSKLAVSSSDSKKKRSLLITTSLDGGLMVQKVSLSNKTAPLDQDRGGAAANPFSSTFTRFSYASLLSRGTQSTPSTPTSGGVSGQVQSTRLTEYRTHSSRDPLASLVVASDAAAGHVAFAGGHDDVVLVYGINSACAVASVYSHRDAVTGLDLIAAGKNRKPSALWLDHATHIMVSGSWDATVKVWSVCVSAGETVAIHREPLAELFDADSSIVSVSACSVANDGIVIAAGCADGSFCVWNIHNDGMQVLVHKEPPSKRGSGQCSAIQWVSYNSDARISSSGQQLLHLFCCFSTGKVASYTLLDGASRLLFTAAVSVGVSVLSMVYSEGVLLVGCCDGGLRLVPVQYRRGGPNNVLGFFFDSKPTLWKGVNSKASPGICSISVAYTTASSSTGETQSDNIKRRKRCICCTGAEDGSVALFELKLATPPPTTTDSMSASS